MIVEYTAVDRAGRQVSDTVDAADVRSAVDTLRKKSMFVTHAAEKHDGAPRPTARAVRHKGQQVKLSIRQLTMFTRQMAMLLTSGSGVVPALQSIAKQFEKPAPRQMVRQLCTDLEEGNTLAEALRKFPRTFDSTYCALVAAGEASATLTEMFTRLAKIIGKRRAMRNKAMGAMAYPTLLSALSVNILGVLMFFVLPRFKDMFKTLNVPLPGTTQLMLIVADFARTYWYGVLAAMLAAGFGIVTFAVSDRGRTWLSNLLLHVPILGKLMSGLIQGETFRVLGMLIEARISVLESIDLVRGVTGNRRFQQLYESMENDISGGGSISQSLERSGLISAGICQAIHTGEDSGQLGVSMNYVADILDEDNTELINTVTKLVEPLILIVMGVVVGFVAVSLFLPLFDVTSAIG